MSHNESAIEHILYLDRDNQEVWRGKQRLKLTPKAFAVLAYLVTHAERVVDKKELLHELWPAADVSEWVLPTCIREIRRELEDVARTSRYIKTAYRRGYQFIGPLSARPRPPAEARRQRSAGGTPQCVGRDRHHAQLRQAFESALTGTRQIVFVTGEPGIGKTTLVETFVNDISASARGWLGRGQCINLYGRGEAYLPVLEALERACQGEGGTALADGLWRYAPTWGYQIPTLRQTAQTQQHHRQLHEATQGRMLREIAEALEKITQHRSLVLWLEDLHWSDSATLDFLSYIARREEPAQLLIIGTYRPEDIADLQHPLHTIKQELQLHKRCIEIPLPLLTETAVEEYLCVRFGTPTLPPPCSHFVHQRSEGNPLFMLNVVDDLVARELLMPRPSGLIFASQAAQQQGGVPDDLQHMIEMQLERLSQPDLRLLEVASVVGARFCVAALVAGAEQPAEQLEARCEHLGQQNQFIVATGQEEWPDGTASAQYGFRHALYQEVLYERLPLGQRSLVHQRIGSRLETAYRSEVKTIAAELAVHFEQAARYPQAIQYRWTAAEKAMRKSAGQEAIAHLTQGLRLLDLLPDSPERKQQELALLVSLGRALMMARGFTDPDLDRTYRRARVLCQQLEESAQLVPALYGISAFHTVRGETALALECASQLFRIAEHVAFDPFLALAHYALGGSLFTRGKLREAQGHFEQSISLSNTEQYNPRFFSGQDIKACAAIYASLTLWMLGYPDQARIKGREALSWAYEIAHPFSLAHVLAYDGFLSRFMDTSMVVQRKAQAVQALATEHEIPLWHITGMTLGGWAVSELGEVHAGCALIEQGVAAHRAIGGAIFFPATLALYAETLRNAGLREEEWRLSTRPWPL